MSTRVNAVIASLSLAVLVASLNKHWHLWGLDSAQAFPLWFQILLTAGVIISTVPPVSARLSHLIHDRLEGITSAGIGKIYLAFWLALVLLFVVLSSQNHLLGDGYLIMGNIESKKIFYFTEPLACLAPRALYAVLGPGETAALWAHRLWAYAGGAAFLAALYFLISDRKHLIAALSLTLTVAAVQLFFGYVENYVFSFVLMFIYALSADRDIRRGRLSILTMMVLILGVAFHLRGLVLIPSFIYLIWVTSRSRRAVVGTLAAGAVFALGAFLFAGSYIHWGSVFVPLTAQSKGAYYLTSEDHILDMANIFLRNYPLLLILIFFPLMTDHRRNYFHSIAIAFALLFILVVDPIMGAFRDWDLLSVAAGPVLAYGIVRFVEWAQKDSVKAYAVLVPLLLFGFLHTGSWIWLNAQKAESYAYDKAVIGNDAHHSQYYLKGFRNKSYGLIALEKYGDATEAIRAWETRRAGEPRDGDNFIFLMKAYLTAGDTTRLGSLIGDNWPKFIDDSVMISGMVTFLIRSGFYREAENICAALIARGRTDFDIFHDLALLKGKRGASDSSFMIMDRAYQICPDAPTGEAVGFYIAAIQRGYVALARSGLPRILPRLKGVQKEMVEALIEALNRGDMQKVNSIIDSPV